jgi:DNA-binding CsgD family transcriptional regulator
MDTQATNYITGDTAFAVDQRGAIVLWNKTAEKTLGYPSSDALGQKCWKLLFGEDTYGNRYCCRHCPVRKMAFNREPVNNFQFTCKTNSNESKHFSVSCLTVFDNHGDEMLLHICRPEDDSGTTVVNQATIRTPTSKHPGTLSQRELEVLTLLADKISTSDIAKTLSISIRTVRTHIQHLMYKLQVHKRCEAVEAGKHLKLI